ncbi:hypothetical protein GmHk_11G033180 [Glycine max]|nr:hypothetical protein GmHk_11G033180 [Glycine max]
MRLFVIPKNLLESGIPLLISDNFADWKDQILLTLGCMELDLTLRVDESFIPTVETAQVNKENYERWERFNHLSLMLIKSHTSKSTRRYIPKINKVKTYMNVIEEQFLSSDKFVAITLMKKLSSINCDNIKGVLEISEPFLVHFILNSLSPQYGPFKFFYNIHKDKWSINELLTMRIQEKERLKHGAPESAHMVTHNKGNGRRGNGVLGVHKTVQMKRNETKIDCFFCK